MQCNEVRNYFAEFVKERLDASTQAELGRHLRECPSCNSEVEALTDAWIKLATLPAGEPPSPDMDTRFRMAVEKHKLESKHAAIGPARASLRLWARRSLCAAAAVSLAVVFFWIFRVPRLPQSPEAVLEVGLLYRTAGSKIASVHAGDSVRLYDTLRSGTDAGAMLVLPDGSHVEMRSESELSLERANDGLSIHLSRGGVIVNAARQRSGHLYVQTKDVLVSVVGTVFVVNAEAEGSRVAVIQGEVRVQQGSVEKKLAPGEQLATSPHMVAVPVLQELLWSQNAQAHLALLQQSLTLLQQAAAPSPIAVPQSPVPKWEAVSIKPCSPDPTARGGGRGGLGVSPGRLFMTCMPVMFAIQDAYIRSARETLKHPGSVSISGGPSWINSDLYSIEAKAEGRPKGQVMEGPMLQALLEDRFKLKIRREVKEVPVYELVVDKGGKIEPLKDEDCGSKWVDPAQDDRSTAERLAEFKAAPGKACGATRFGPPREPGKPSMIDFYGMNFDDIAAGLRVVLDRDVINKTGLSGLYHFHLTFQPDQTTAGGLFHAAPVDDTPTGAPFIFKAIQEQMGMRLDSAKGPGESLVIESIERPTVN
jgi:uncharacterized protein (TIGR03435 family)